MEECSILILFAIKGRLWRWVIEKTVIFWNRKDRWPYLATDVRCAYSLLLECSTVPDPEESTFALLWYRTMAWCGMVAPPTLAPPPGDYCWEIFNCVKNSPPGQNFCVFLALHHFVFFLLSFPRKLSHIFTPKRMVVTCVCLLPMLLQQEKVYLSVVLSWTQVKTEKLLGFLKHFQPSNF